MVRDRLRNAEVPRRVGRWLAVPEHAARVTAELARALRGAVDVLRDEDLRAVLEPVVLRRLAALPVGPTLGRLLAEVVADKAHHRLVDLVVRRGGRLAGREPGAGDRPRRPAGAAVVAGVRRPRGRRPGLRRADPGLGRGAGRSRSTRSGRRWTGCWPGSPSDLSNDPATIERASGVLESLLAQPEVRRAFGDVIAAGRRLLLEMVDDPDGELRARLTGALADLGRRLDTDDALRARVDAIVADAPATWSPTTGTS